MVADYLPRAEKRDVYNTIGISSGQDILRTYLHRYIINWAK